MEFNSSSLFFCVFFPFYFLERKNFIHSNISTICQLNCIESFTENSFCATIFSTDRSYTWLRAIHFSPAFFTVIPYKTNNGCNVPIFTFHKMGIRKMQERPIDFSYTIVICFACIHACIIFLYS